jgi:hypothetical protein
MAEAWFNYADLGLALGISPEAARQKALRGRWRRQRGNDGRAQVLVDIEAQRTSHVPRKRSDNTAVEHPSNTRTIAALEGHIATLKADLTKADALAKLRHGEVEAVRKQLDANIAELAALARLMAQREAVRDKLQAEFDAYRSRPWWRRWPARA